jgi:hypothetical protein
MRLMFILSDEPGEPFLQVMGKSSLTADAKIEDPREAEALRRVAKRLGDIRDLIPPKGVTA